MGLDKLSKAANEKEKRLQLPKTDIKVDFDSTSNIIENGYIAGYTSSDPSYVGVVDAGGNYRTSYKLTDENPNVGLDGIKYSITDRALWSDDKGITNQDIFLYDADRRFRYVYDNSSPYSDDDYEEPTILGFELYVDVGESPLFDCGENNTTVKNQVINRAETNTQLSEIPKITLLYESVIEEFDTDGTIINTTMKLDSSGRQTYEIIRKDGVNITGKGTTYVDSKDLESKNISLYTELYNAYDNQIKLSQSSTPIATTQTPPTQTYKQGTISYFLNKYVGMDTLDTKNRLLLVKEFQNLFLQIIPTEGNDKEKRPYYIQEIIGLDKINSFYINGKFPTPKEDYLTITVVEDIGLRLTYLSHLYNNIAYSYRHKRKAVPENLLRFELKIKISDKRKFNRPKTQAELAANQNNKQSINDYFTGAENPYIVYTLYDCLLDFSDSMPHLQNITMGGFSNPGDTPAILTFKIRYKSVSKEFESKLIGKISPDSTGSYYLNNMMEGMFNTVDYNLSSNIQFKAASGENKQNVKNINNKLSKLKPGIPKVQKLLDNATKSAKNILLTEARKLRGDLISKITDKITKGDFVNEIYPSNIYDINLDGISDDDLSNQRVGDKLVDVGRNLIAQTVREAIKNFNDYTTF